MPWIPGELRLPDRGVEKSLSCWGLIGCPWAAFSPRAALLLGGKDRPTGPKAVERNSPPISPAWLSRIWCQKPP